MEQPDHPDGNGGAWPQVPAPPQVPFLPSDNSELDYARQNDAATISALTSPSQSSGPASIWSVTNSASNFSFRDVVRGVEDDWYSIFLRRLTTDAKYELTKEDVKHRNTEVVEDIIIGL